MACTIWNGNGSIVMAGTPGGRQSSALPVSRSAASVTRNASAPRAGLISVTSLTLRSAAQTPDRSGLPSASRGTAVGCGAAGCGAAVAAVAPVTVTVTVRVTGSPGPIAVYVYVVVARGTTRRVPRVGTTLAEMERQLVTETLAALSGNRTRAARALGLQRTHFLRLVRDHLADQESGQRQRIRVVEYQGGRQPQPCRRTQAVAPRRGISRRMAPSTRGRGFFAVPRFIPAPSARPPLAGVHLTRSHPGERSTPRARRSASAASWTSSRPNANP